MPTNKPYQKRLVLATTLILAAAVAGLFMLNIEQVTADKGLAAENTVPAEGPTDQELGVLPSGNVTKAFLKMISALIVVIVIVYLALYFLRRMMGRRYGHTAGGELLEILQTAYVGPHKAVSLVRIADRSVLIGVTDHQVSVLTELDAAETSKLLNAAGNGERESFADVLKKTVQKVKEIGLGKKRAVLET